MRFRVAIEDEARSVAPGLAEGDAGVGLTDTELCVRLGRLLSLRAPLAAVEGAALMPDPRPAVYLPPGVSAAVQQLGRDMIFAIGSHEGLVRIDFKQAIMAEIRPPTVFGTSEAAREGPTLDCRHLVVSLEDPEGFVEALRERVRAGIAPSAPVHM